MLKIGRRPSGTPAAIFTFEVVKSMPALVYWEEHPDPRIVLRLHGRGRVVEPGEPEWDGLIAGFPEYPGIRSVIFVVVERIPDSCGFAVPLYDYKGDRSQLIAYANNKGPEGMEEYKARKNRASIDGIDGLRSVGGKGR